MEKRKLIWWLRLKMMFEGKLSPKNSDKLLKLKSIIEKNYTFSKN